MRIAVDAMGGDYAPREIVRGAVEAADQLPAVSRILLVGDTEAIRREFQSLPGIPDKIEVHHASEVVGMEEPPALAVRKKKDSSISRAVDLVKQGTADAVVSAGNTGAVVVAATLKLRTLEGIERPAIAAVMPSQKGRPFVLIDAGANTDCTAGLLRQFAIMGSIYSRVILNQPNPVVGLLSIGGEETKGNEITKEAFGILSKARLNFRGNVEGHDLFRGETDVIVTDGFVGNVVLKTSEGTAHAIGHWMKEEFRSNPIRKAGALLLRGALNAMRQRLDTEMYGGAPLLGVQGVCIITHGASTQRAILHAVRVACEAVEQRVAQLIVSEILRSGMDGQEMNGMGHRNMAVAITGTGSYLPERVLTNDELARMVDTSDEWIRERTGIRERRIAAENEASSDMGAKASLRAMESAGISPSDVQLIVVATVTPDMVFPSMACFIQQRIGAKNAFCFDIEAACAGFLYGVELAKHFIAAGTLDTALVIGAEKLSCITDWKDRTTCVLFGDGAGAAVVQARASGRGIISSVMGSDGTLTDLLNLPAGGSRNPTSPRTVAEGLHYMKMTGREVFKHAVRCMCDAAQRAIGQSGLTINDIHCVIPHQANMRIIQAVAERLGVPMERFYINLDRVGNISGASVPVALDEAIRGGRVKQGDVVLFVAFGGGFTWGATVMEI